LLQYRGLAVIVFSESAAGSLPFLRLKKKQNGHNKAPEMHKDLVKLSALVPLWFLQTKTNVMLLPFLNH